MQRTCQEPGIRESHVGVHTIQAGIPYDVARRRGLVGGSCSLPLDAKSRPYRVEIRVLFVNEEGKRTTSASYTRKFCNFLNSATRLIVVL